MGIVVDSQHSLNSLVPGQQRVDGGFIRMVNVWQPLEEVFELAELPQLGAEKKFLVALYHQASRLGVAL
jgi:hypothetical protein